MTRRINAAGLSHKVMTDAERTKLSGIAAGATVNTGTVTSVGVAVPAGLTATAAVTTSGTITINYAFGYQGYTAAEANKLAGIAPSADKTPVLATIATSGSYNDLDDRPVIPAAQVQADWNAASGISSIANKPATFLPSAHTHTKDQVGLSNVDNTSDVNKPVSTAQQTALGLKLDKTGGTMTGDLTVSNGRGIKTTWLVLDPAQPVNATDATPKQYVDLKSGEGQRWYDVTAQRAKDTAYLNNTGRSIEVILRQKKAGTRYLAASVAGQQIVDLYDWTDHERQNQVSFIVPNGAHYAMGWEGTWGQVILELR